MRKGSIPVNASVAALIDITKHTGPLEGGLYIVSGTKNPSGTHTLYILDASVTTTTTSGFAAKDVYTDVACTGTTTMASKIVAVPDGFALAVGNGSSGITGTFSYTKI